MPIYYAHSTDNPDKSDWQELSEHLLNVAKLAEKFAAGFGAERWGYCVDLLHDTGKACKNFLDRLECKNIRVDHALFGAKLAREIDGQFGLLLAYIICGHHGGLPDRGAQEGQLHHRLRKYRQGQHWVRSTTPGGRFSASALQRQPKRKAFSP